MTPKEILEKAGRLNGATFIFCAVAKMFSLDTENYLRKLGKEYGYQEKYLINRQAEQAEQLRKNIAQLDHQLFNSHKEDDVLDDVGYFYDIYRLIIDRTGDDQEAMTKVRSLIYNMPSKLNSYE